MTTAPELTESEWTDLTKRLLVYADRKLMRLYWRGVPAAKGGRPPGGVEPHDLVWDAVELVLAGNSWDPEEHPDLEDYMRGVISSRVSTMVNLLENRVTRRASPARPADDDAPQPPEASVADATPGPAKVVANEELRVQMRALMAEELGEDPITMAVLECVDAGVTKPAEIAELTGHAVTAIYTARRKFKRASERVRKAFGQRSGQ